MYPIFMYLSEKFIGNSKILIDWVRAMTKLYVSTLGFEEKFTIRGLLRASLNPGDFIHVFLAEPLEDKAKNALEIVKKFVEEYLGFIELRYTVLPVIEYSKAIGKAVNCLLYTSPSPRDLSTSRMPSSA